MANWQPLKTAPVGPTVLVANAETGHVWPAYGYWRGRIPFPFWCSLDPEGMGVCKPTHWMPLPEAPAHVQQEEAA